MKLTPKEWNSFQHYKERRPPWIKLHRPLLDNADFQRLPIASRALAPMLWLIAAEYDNGTIMADLEDIAWRLRMSAAELKDALRPLLEKGFFSSDDDASVALAECEQEVPPEREAQVKTEAKKNSRAASPSSEDFENFKKEYPKRTGNYGWKAAERKYTALIKTGVSPQAILTAVRRHAEEMRKLKRVGTEYVPMPARWLNAEDFVHAAVETFTSEQKPIDWDNVLAFYKRTKVWTRDVGPDPESPACQAPPEILRKYGIEPLGAS